MNVETIAFVLLFAVTLYLGVGLFFGRTERSLSEEWEEEDREKGTPYGRFARRLKTFSPGLEPWMAIVALVLGATLVFLLSIEILAGKPLIAGVITLAMVILAFNVYRDLWEWRIRRFEEELVDAVDIMQAALQAGQTPAQSLTLAAEASRGAVKRELGEVAQRLDLGMRIEQATQRLREWYDCEGVRLFTQVLIAKWNVGGDFALMMKSVNRIIRERVKLKVRLQGQLAGARYAAVLVAFLPYLVIPVMLWQDPDWWPTLSRHPWGPRALAGAILLQVVGFIWLRKTLRTEI